MNWSPANLYALADKLCVNELMDVVLDTIRKHGRETNGIPVLETVREGYELTPPGSTYRKYLAYCCATYILGKAWVSVDASDISVLMVDLPDLNLDVVRILQATEGNFQEPNELPNCKFHTHEKGVPCPWKTADSE